MKLKVCLISLHYKNSHSFFLRTTLALEFFFKMAESVFQRNKEFVYTTGHTDIPENTGRRMQELESVVLHKHTQIGFGC